MLEEWRRCIGGENYMSNYRPKRAAVSAHDPLVGVWWYIIRVGSKDVGTVWLERDAAREKAVLGIFLGEESLFGRGIGAEAINAAIEKVREDGTIHKVMLHVRENNVRAIACYAKCGFVTTSSGVKRVPGGKEIHYFTMARDL